MMKSLNLAGASALVLTASLVGAAPAFADEDAVTVSGNVAIVSDYRFRGVSLSDETIALQGGFDLGFANGLYVGTWASSIDQVGNSELELDLYGGYGGEFANGVSFDVGVLGYFYPGGEDLEYGELYGSLGGTVGLFDLGVGVAYAPEQDNIGNEDNTYFYATADAPLGDTPFTFNSSIGLEDGAFGDDKVDWLIGVSTSFYGLDVGLAYIDTSEDFDGADATGVLTISKSL